METTEIGTRAEMCIRNARASQYLKKTAPDADTSAALHDSMLDWVEEARHAINEFEHEQFEFDSIVGNAVLEVKREWKRVVEVGNDKRDAIGRFNSIIMRISDRYNISSTCIYFELARVGAQS